MTIQQVRKLASAALTQQDAAFFLQESQISDFFIPSPSPVLDADCILEFVLNKNKTYFLLHGNEEISSENISKICECVTKRRKGLPIAYITGHKEFYGFDFIVTPDVLIPKPDTEILVELAINYIKEKILANPNKILTICDMCTGSGCIAWTLALEIPGAQVCAVDISEGALEVAASQNFKEEISSTGAQKPMFLKADVLQGPENSLRLWPTGSDSPLRSCLNSQR